MWKELLNNIQSATALIENKSCPAELKRGSTNQRSAEHTRTPEKAEKKIQQDISGSKVMTKYVCPKCNADMCVSNCVVTCHKCGMEYQIFSENGIFNNNIFVEHTTTKRSKMSFRLAGQNAQDFKGTFTNICTGSASSIEEEKQRLFDLNEHFVWGRKISASVISTAVDMFYRIKQSGYSFRGETSKMGVMGACLYYACISHKETRSPKAIANFLHIDDKTLSKRQKFLRELHVSNVIKIQVSFDPIEDYIAQFFESLEIPNKYQAFVIDIIRTAERKYIHLQCDCKTSTKCVGAIYLLTTRIPSLRGIKKERISKECHISKMTFLKYHDLLVEHYKRIRNVFKRHRIPMDPSWRKDDKKKR